MRAEEKEKDVVEIAEPSFADWKKRKVAYSKWGKQRNPDLEDFQECVHDLAKSRGWTVARTLKWIARSTGVSQGCVQNWMENGDTRWPSTRTWKYLMKQAFGITYERHIG